MNKKIGKALLTIGLPVYFINKGVKKDKEYIIFNYSSYPSYYADNTLKCTNYTILINLYCISNIEQYKTNILKTMREYGFNGGNSEPTNTESDSNGNLIYNTAITFKGFLRAD